MRIVFLLALLLSPAAALWAQVRVHGYVREATTGESLSYATVRIPGSTVGTHANANGYYSLQIPEGAVCLHASFAGYGGAEACFAASQDTLLSFALSPATLQEVAVTARIPLAEQTLLGFQKVPIQTIKELPSFLGEPDVLRALTLIPGVVTGREGMGNLFVRGGDRGQNLVLLDGVPLYNTTHLGGFVGVVNSRAIKDVEVYKGGFPARFGGRASSVIDIRTRDGNKQEHEASMHMGLVNSGFSVEGPLRQGTTSYHLTGRASYLDLILLPVRLNVQQQGEGFYPGYTFFDINGKLTHQFSDRHKLYLTGYTGYDRYEVVDILNNPNGGRTQSTFGVNLQQDILTLGQQINLGPRLYWEQRLGYTQFFTGFDLTNFNDNPTQNLFEEFYFFSEAAIRTGEYTTELIWDLHPRHTLTAGMQGQLLSHNPGSFSLMFRFQQDQPFRDTLFTPEQDIYPRLLNGHIEDKMTLLPGLEAVLGLRYSHFQNDTTTFANWEPRASLRWALSPQTALKLNYTRMAQYLHVLVDASAGFQREIWLMADEQTPPQLAQQVSVGVFHSPGTRWEAGLEAYYKWQQNSLFLPVNAGYDNLITWRDNMETGGMGRAYGLELYGEYRGQVLSGTLGYALAWSERQFESLNFGDWFPQSFDRRHNLNLTGRWQIAPHRILTGNFVYNSGIPITLATGYIPPGEWVQEQYIIEGINQSRLPAYHRLDLAYRKETDGPKWAASGYWGVSVYNIYARQNPSSLFWREGQLYQRTDILIIPSIQFGLTF